MSDNRFQQMARDYDTMAPILVPHYGLMQSVMLDYLKLEDADHPVVVDLGAGSGRLLERVLHRNPAARCYYVDMSDAFMAIAKEKLQRYNGQMQYVLSDFENGWIDHLPEKPDYIFSMSAIHHLENHAKQDLYQRCFDFLNPGGWFVNIDEMKTIYLDAYYNSLQYWVRHGEEQGKRLSARYLDLFRKWQDHFKKWKARNIQGFGMPKSKGDDIHESFIVQMAWLRECGFTQVDLFLKIHLWCIIGGKKNQDQRIKNKEQRQKIKKD